MDHVQFSKELTKILGITKNTERLCAIIIVDNQAYLTIEINGLRPEETATIRAKDNTSLVYSRQLARALSGGQAPLKRFVSTKAQVIDGRQCYQIDMVWEFARTVLITNDDE